MKNRILVTGGLGFIGSYFVELALSKGYFVINVDKQTYASRKDLDFSKYDNYEYINDDICTLHHLPTNIDWIVNFAAETHVDNSILSNDVFLQSNIKGVYNLLELIRTRDPGDRPRLLQISTDEVYGDILNGSKNEDSCLFPSNPYSATKSAAEQLIYAWGRTYGVKYIICRSSNNYGYGQHEEKLIPRTIELTLQNKKMTVHGNGSYSREWTYVGDNCEGILTAMEKGKEGEIYNISSCEMMTNLEIVKKILVTMGKPEDHYVLTENRVGQDIRYSVNPEKLKKLGWQPKMNLEEYLPELIKKYQKINEK
ncbi:MAG: GDP-mannose 4,6-dehydratase [Candidatus Paceibacterota bacterium]